MNEYEWQPIKTAPLNEWVFLFAEKLQEGRTAKMIKGIKKDTYWDSSIGKINPTHWMPLSEPSAGEKK